MADYKLRLPDELAECFDGWAADRGGRSPALRHLIRQACAPSFRRPATTRLSRRPAKLTVRLTAADALALEAEAAKAGLTRNGWVAALVRRRLTGRPTFARADELPLLAVQAEVRRIGVNVNQIARAVNTAVLAGQVLDLQLSYLEDLRMELRAHMFTLREAFAGNLAYWDVDL